MDLSPSDVLFKKKYLTFEKTPSEDYGKETVTHFRM